MLRATAIPIPETEFLQLCAASTWLCPADRDQFFAAIADALAGHEIGPGSTGRAICAAFEKFYQPIDVPDEPKPLRKLEVGTNKLGTLYDLHEARRMRRLRVDAR